MSAQTFPFRFTGLNKGMAVLGMTPGRCDVVLTDEALRVRFSWAFELTVPRASVRSAAHDHQRVTGWGAHGWRGNWLVNGSSSGIVRIELDPPGNAKVLGMPSAWAKVSVLRVSVEDPNGLIAALDMP